LEADGAETPDMELIYDYSSSDDEETGSQINLKEGIVSSTFVQRRPASRAGIKI
jgi:hypothetical protein